MMTADGNVKGMHSVLIERGFDVSKMQAKCAPVCPVENESCCMARLLSHQDDFKNQELLLERKIRDAGHECIFLPKFHCELNPIEMVSICTKYPYLNSCACSIGIGASINITKSPRQHLMPQKHWPGSIVMHVHWRPFGGLLIDLGVS